MIVRIWRGETPEAKADAYFDYMMNTGVKSYRATEGNQGVWVLRRKHEGKAEFLLVSLWDSFEAIHRFAGEDAQQAVYFPGDKEYLLTFEPTVAHYDVLSAFSE